MSRIGRRPVEIPESVRVACADGVLEVKGPKGTLSLAIPEPISAELGEREIRLTRPDETKKNRSLHGLARALVGNMVRGVTEGFTRELLIEGVGYRAEMKGKQLSLALGFSHPVEVPVPGDLEVSVDGTTKIRIHGINKQVVGQFAADVRSIRPPEPYKGKGIRYADEQIRRKVGKAGVASS